jgi:hypothetical protein
MMKDREFPKPVAGKSLSRESHYTRATDAQASTHLLAGLVFV